MERGRLNLDNLLPLWEREFADLLDKSVFESLGRRDMNISDSAGRENVIGQPRSLTQDAFSAAVIRQGGIKSGL